MIPATMDSKVLYQYCYVDDRGFCAIFKNVERVELFGASVFGDTAKI